MDLIQIIVLALIQGLTEFLPISSSAHLILVPQLLHWPDQGLAFDVAVHIGTLTAVLWYFKPQLIPLFIDWKDSIIERKLVKSSIVSWGVLLGTIPVGLFGLALSDTISELRSPLVIASTTIIFGIVLFIADKNAHRNTKSEYQMTLNAILIIGLAQAIALIPGTSRSGITISAALLLGFNRTGAARFSFLLSIPVILLAGALETIHLIESPEAIDWLALCLGALISAISAYFCIVFFIKLLDKIGMLPFIIYRLILGVFLLLTFYNI